MTDYDDLRAKALATEQTHSSAAWFVRDKDGWCVAGDVYEAQKWIAAANPAVILALLDELDALKRRLVSAESALEDEYVFADAIASAIGGTT